MRAIIELKEHTETPAAEAQGAAGDGPLNGSGGHDEPGGIP